MKKHPNILFVFPDQMRGSAMGFLNEESVKTPHLDKFSKESLVLTQAASNFPVCSPYRAMWLSGKYPHANGVVGNCNSKSAKWGVELKQSQRCWSDVLSDSGYSLGYIGKWHLDAPQEPFIDCKNNQGEIKWNEWCPPERRHGFDFWYSYGTYDFHMNPMYWSTDAQRDEFHFVDQWGPEHEADVAIQYLKNEGKRYRDPNQPFALAVSMNPPHTPYGAVPDSYQEQYENMDVEQGIQENIPPEEMYWGSHHRKVLPYYYAMISGVDEQFGRILKALDEEGLADDTIVVFTSDHGDCLGAHEVESKPSIFEEAVRVPYLVRWPEKIKPRREEFLISTPDFYPTILDLVGLSNEKPEDLDGTSFADCFLGQADSEVEEQFLLQMRSVAPHQGVRGLRTERYTFAAEEQSGKLHLSLFDRKLDRYQMDNVVEEKPELVHSFLLTLIKKLEENNDPWLKEHRDLLDAFLQQRDSLNLSQNSEAVA